MGESYELKAQMYPAKVATLNERGTTMHVHPFVVTEFRVFRSGIQITHVKFGLDGGQSGTTVQSA